MQHFRKFLSNYKILFVFFVLLISPFVLIVALLYGVIVGAIGATVDIWESTRRMMRREKWEGIKYSKWSEQDYQKRTLDQISNYGARLLKETEFKYGQAKVPKLWVRIYTYLLLGIGFFPFVLIWGIVTGPIRAFLLFSDWCTETWTGKIT